LNDWDRADQVRLYIGIVELNTTGVFLIRGLRMKVPSWSRMRQLFAPVIEKAHPLKLVDQTHVGASERPLN
jgi:hypothetical protein